MYFHVAASITAWMSRTKSKKHNPYVIYVMPWRSSGLVIASEIFARHLNMGSDI